MKVHQHSSTNMLLGAPKGMQNCDTIPATMVIDDEVKGTARVLSFWRPSKEELRLLNVGHSVCLHVYGSIHPPVMLTVEKS